MVKFKSRSDRPRFKVSKARIHTGRKCLSGDSSVEVTFLWEYRSLAGLFNVCATDFFLAGTAGTGAELESPKAPCQDIIATHKASEGVSTNA
jgi:hypothetical protein